MQQMYNELDLVMSFGSGEQFNGGDKRMRGVKKYYLDYGVVVGFKNKLLGFSLSIVMIFASVASALPLFLTQTVSATPSLVYNTTSHEGFNTLNEAMADADTQNGDTIELNDSLVVTNQQTITKSVTIDGKGNTLSAGFTKTGNYNNSAIGVQADNVTIKNITVDGNGSAGLHGINVYESTGVDVNDITIKNFKAGFVYGLLVNSSEVTVNNITTVGNFTGINIDQKTSEPAKLTVNGVSSHNDLGGSLIPGLGIYVDNASVNFEVNDTNSQYNTVSRIIRSNDMGYALKPITPDTTAPVIGDIKVIAEGGSEMTSSPRYNPWKVITTGNSDEDSGIAGVYAYVYRQDGDHWTRLDPVESNGEIHNFMQGQDNLDYWVSSKNSGNFEDGHTYRLVVWAKDKAGNESTHTDAQTVPDSASMPSYFSPAFTIDHTAPKAPAITSPGARTWHKSSPINNSWTAITEDVNGNTENVDYYQIAYNYDDGHNFGGSTCSGLAISGVSDFIGCRDVDVDSTSRSHQPNLTEEGGVTIWVRAVDQAGNVGAWSRSVHYYYDHTTPSTDINVSPVVNGQFTVSGSASDNLHLNRVYVQLVSRTDSLRCGGTTINLIPFGTSYNWSKNYDIRTLMSVSSAPVNCSEGNYAAHVAVVDMAGNTSSAGWTSDFLVDITAPTIAINGYSGTSTTPLITGTIDDPTADIEISIDGGTPQPATNNGDDTWSYQVPSSSPLTEGAHTLSVIATDASSNASTPATAGITVAAATPAVVITPITTGGPVVADAGTPGVLGDSTTNPPANLSDIDEQVLGDSTTSGEQNSGNDDDSCTKFLGICWYYWSPVVIVIAGAVYYGYKRHDKGQNTVK